MLEWGKYLPQSGTSHCPPQQRVGARDPLLMGCTVHLDEAKGELPRYTGLKGAPTAVGSTQTHYFLVILRIASHAPQ